MTIAGQNFIDVRELIKKYSVEELNRTADAYFQRHKTPDVIGKVLSKPFIIAEHTPRLILSFAHLMQGLQLAPDMTILDFGCGPGWASRCLTQLGYKVIACDVSEAALNLGRQGLELFPIQGPHHPQTFLLFDGRKFDLPDASVDRIFCLDAFHHVPNQQEVLREMARILKPGGIAGFSEPGPTHSRSPGSQEEMRNFTVIENDIILEEIWELARQVGFADLQVGFFTPSPHLLPPKVYEAHVNEGAPLPNLTQQSARQQMIGLRLFFLYRYLDCPHTSREAVGLHADIHVEAPTSPISPQTKFPLNVRIRNTGKALWLRSGPNQGAVHLSVKRQTGFWKKQLVEHGRFALPTTASGGCGPGEEVAFTVQVPGLPKGQHTLVFDLVSEMVCWFSDLGSPVARLSVRVG